MRTSRSYNLLVYIDEYHRYTFMIPVDTFTEEQWNNIKESCIPPTFFEGEYITDWYERYERFRHEISGYVLEGIYKDITIECDIWFDISGKYITK